MHSFEVDHWDGMKIVRFERTTYICISEIRKHLKKQKTPVVCVGLDLCVDPFWQHYVVWVS